MSLTGTSLSSEVIKYHHFIISFVIWVLGSVKFTSPRLKNTKSYTLKRNSAPKTWERSLNSPGESSKANSIRLKRYKCIWKGIYNKIYNDWCLFGGIKRDLWRSRLIILLDFIEEISIQSVQISSSVPFGTFMIIQLTTAVILKGLYIR